MKRRKITIVGAGNVGGTAAHIFAERETGDVILLDIVRDLAVGKALDITQSSPIFQSNTRVIGTDDYGLTENSDIIIVTSGVPRKPGMSRDDLLKINAKIVRDVIECLAKRSPNGIIIIVSNPVDAMTYAGYKVSGFPKERIMGMAGVLDSARFKAFIAMEINVSVEDIDAFVLGGHGDSMVPSIQYTTVAGIPVSDLIPKEKLTAIVERTRNGGGEIVKLLKSGSAYYAPAASIVEMVDTIIKDKKKILPCAALCKGEYGINEIFIGVPVRLGKNGIDKIIEVGLAEEELSALKRSADVVKELCNEVDKII
ncbi:MAG: malate dehydrogenase [Nitrospirota bacterium]